jgi:hypothetical protein
MMSSVTRLRRVRRRCASGMVTGGRINDCGVKWMDGPLCETRGWRAAVRHHEVTIWRAETNVL